MRGRRAAGAHVVVHAASGDDPCPRVGFVVAKSVGGAVVRNRVKRRLRHLMAQRLERLAPGAMLVLRALPSSANAESAELGRDLDRVMARLGPDWAWPE